ncbi:sucrase ferredoxin [Gemmobacter serpentinus]|uniref:sucrase ferredoxin n=1 Tax=Gemmobacter serpentinus TaxID=2652247 RepID=UPI001CF69E2C|nr:sucrase ferredoxin [Gemmobacter serpentinus]
MTPEPMPGPMPRPMNGRQFCRDLTLARKEPLIGMGQAAARYILLRWPRGAWRVPRAQSRDMPPALSDAIRTATAHGAHVALVEGDDIALSAGGRIRSACSAQEAARLLPGLALGAELDGQPDPRQIILCCTDGRQDPCCARYGHATFRALRAAADPTRFRILQSTHLGGCRFAASLVHLPSRHRYGHLTPEQVPEFLAALGADQPYLPAWRGNPELSAPAQVAEHAALTWAARQGQIASQVAFEQAPAPPDGATRTEAIVTIAGTRLQIMLELVDLAVNTRCITLRDPQPARVRRWRAAALAQL